MVFIFENDALDKMILVEGVRWGQLQVDPDNPYGATSFQTFKKAWYEYFASLQSRYGLTDEREVAAHLDGVNDTGLNAPDGGAAIYGDGGWNRYIVRLSGEILFLEALGPADAKRALAAGFRLF